MRRVITAALALLTALSLCACGTAVQSARDPDSLDATQIDLTGSGARISGGGASVSGSRVTVSASGAYRLRGTLDNGQIVVDTGEDAGKVTLYLEGAEISCADDAAILVRQADYTVIYCREGSENRVCSGTTAADLAPADESANGAAIFAEDDLIFDGPGKLTVEGWINNAVTCKDDLEVWSGSLSLSAVNNGLRGSESVSICGGELSIQAANDGIKSSSAKKEGKGYVSISGGGVAIICQGDGVSAETALTVSGGSLSVLTRGAGDKSSKGLKAGGGISLTGGKVSVSATDDGVVSPVSVTVEGGSLAVSAAGDGIQAGEKNGTTGDILITGGDIRVTAGQDGLDAKGRLTLTGGTLLSLGSYKRVKSPSDRGTQGYLAAELVGGAGMAVSICDASGQELDAVESPDYGYNLVLYSSSALTVGAEYTLSAGTRTLRVTAR